MAITGRTPDECFDRFLGHVRPLVTEMMPTKCPMRCPRPGKGLPTDRRTLAFANEQHDDAVQLETRFGTAYLYMMQELCAVPEGRREFRLRTIGYAYKLYAESPTLEGDSVVRWEYVAAKAGHAGPCRHHVQFGKMVTEVPFGTGSFNFTRFHMPTGWVLMEEVFRFLVTELGVKPPCGDRWPEVLRESENAFYKGFTDKGGSGY
jgi:hypothetical protein